MTEKYQDKIGCFLQIPNVGRGQLKYVGPVEGKQGTFVGVDLLANIGKNDGTYMGKRYFETEYPQSGLFIQLQKVARLLELSSDVPLSNTTTAAGNTTTQSNRLSIMTNTSNIEYVGGQNLNKARNRTSSVVYRSPTPRMANTRATSMMSRRTLTSDQSDFLSDSMDVELQGITDNELIADDIDGDVDMEDKHSMLNEAGSILESSKQFKPSSSISYESKIKEQKDEILHYKRLLDDQRIVLEEIQPAIDDYEEKLRFLEAENNRLQKALQSERESQLKKKQYFETEHEQLLSVVDELHKEIKDNEERMLRQKRRQTVIMEDASHLVELESLRSENDALREQIQTLKSFNDDQMRESNEDWEKKYECLKLQHDALTKENDDISRELSDLKRKYHDISRNTIVENKSEIAGYQSEVAILKRELEEARSLISLRTISNSRTPRDLEIENTKFGDSLPLYDGKKKDPAAGRLLWCALCEKDGHSAFECTEVAF